MSSTAQLGSEPEPDGLRELDQHPKLTRLVFRSLALQLHAALETTQSATANTLGVTRVSVANALAELEREGLVVRCYARIEIPDTRTLRTWVHNHSELAPVSARN